MAASASSGVRSGASFHAAIVARADYSFERVRCDRVSHRHCHQFDVSRSHRAKRTSHSHQSDAFRMMPRTNHKAAAVRGCLLRLN